MLVGGIYFGEKTIWDEIIDNMKETGLWSDKEIDRLQEETQGEKEPDEVDMLIESLLNYKDVLEGKVQELEQKNEKLKEALEISVERKEKLMNIIGENNTEIEKLHAKIERQDEEIEGLQMRNTSNSTVIKNLNCKINTIRSRCREEAMDLFDKGEWGLIEIRRTGEKKECGCGNLQEKVKKLEEENTELRLEIEQRDEKNEEMGNRVCTLQLSMDALKFRCLEEEAKSCFDRGLFKALEIRKIGEKEDSGNLKKQIEGLQAEVRDLTAENVRLAITNNHLKNAIRIKEQGSIIGDKLYEELKEKYETADLEREHLAKELDRLRELVKELNERHQQDCIDLNKKQTTINELVDSYSKLRRMKGLSE